MVIIHIYIEDHFLSSLIIYPILHFMFLQFIVESEMLQNLLYF